MAVHAHLVGESLGHYRIIEQIGAGAIEYVPFPENLAGRYQSFTQADLSGLRDAGYGEKFSSLEDGIAKSVKAWDLEQL